MSSKVLTCHQVHCTEFPSEFYLSITYCPSRLATLPDALSGWDYVYPESGVDFISKNPQTFHQVLKQNEIKESRFFSIKAEVLSDLVDQIQKAVWQEKYYNETLKQLARELESAIKRFKKYEHRDRAIPPHFQPGDKVWRASKNIKTTRPTKKLSERWLGTFEGLKKIGRHAYHPKLPQQWKSVHPVFHVSLLELVKQSTIPNRHQLPPPPVKVEEQKKWEVAQVLDSNLKRGT
ncbi:hypothetical protein O181_059593 [Austropuccinia psidii MF-1]|uniref:Tf2-1-like SH3-like domain-containing protein n=1 Tax=Austropuccinia psidii MF-1 TaxID=1389203 RepID=A0A9Q3HWN2_9BASI|nr:hypothetical protein [Austropuccinia psidii MF-1]